MSLIFKGPSDRKLLALTIDDFPSSGIEASGSGTMALLDLLDELAIPATFSRSASGYASTRAWQPEPWRRATSWATTCGVTNGR